MFKNSFNISTQLLFTFLILQQMFKILKKSGKKYFTVNNKYTAIIVQIFILLWLFKNELEKKKKYNIFF